MMAQAQELGANAVLNVRFHERRHRRGGGLYAYGTAAVVTPAA
jgi:uncharacterized protein YbjQ (UPF0145 family)